MYDLPRPRYETPSMHEALKKGVIQNPFMALSKKCHNWKIFSLYFKEVITDEKLI